MNLEKIECPKCHGIGTLKSEFSALYGKERITCTRDGCGFSLEGMMSPDGSVFDRLEEEIGKVEDAKRKSLGNQRERFERWIAGPPYEKDVSRLRADDPQWPDQYRDINVQLAWEAWQEARK